MMRPASGMQDIALSGGSTEDKSLRADLEQLQQAVKKLQHGIRFPGCVAWSMHSGAGNFFSCLVTRQYPAHPCLAGLSSHHIRAL